MAAGLLKLPSEGRVQVRPGKRYEDWRVDDPAGQGVDAVRRIRGEIGGRGRKLVDELTAD